MGNGPQKHNRHVRMFTEQKNGEPSTGFLRVSAFHIQIQALLRISVAFEHFSMGRNPSIVFSMVEKSNLN